MRTPKTREILPARAASLLAEGPRAAKAATKSFRAAWPHRNRDLRARIVARATLSNLRDLRELGIVAPTKESK